MSTRRLSMADRRALWVRWKLGDTITAIARGLGRSQPNLYRVVRAAGGIAPPPRSRANRVLSLREREAISRGLAAGLSQAVISRRLGRAPSTISREIHRHGGRHVYRAHTADRQAWTAARRPKRCRLATSPYLCRVIATRLQARWSPEQIAGWLRTTYPDTAAMRVSHETIYRSLYVQSRGVLKQALIQQLRRRRTMRRARAAGPPQRREMIAAAVPIADRPPQIEDRAVPGHWEGDLIVGTGPSYIATLVERQSRYVMLVRVPNKATRTVMQALARHIRRLPQALRASLTLDRGLEFAAHRAFTVATGTAVYFCDPHSPWQRGSNENTNGLLRQYFPKGTPLGGVSQARLNRVARELNERPRKTLGYRNPAEKYVTLVASTR
jgi:IS30 family transposase